MLWNNTLDFVLGIIPQYSLRFWRVIVLISSQIEFARSKQQQKQQQRKR